MAKGNYGSTGDFKGTKGPNAADGQAKRSDATKKRKRRKQGSAAVDAKVFSGAGGGKGAGRVKLNRSTSLAKSATGKSGTVNARITRESDSFSPVDNSRKRKESRADEPQLAKRLAAIAAGVSPGKSKIGSAISVGLTGAALGATIDEDAERRRKARAKKKKPKKNG